MEIIVIIIAAFITALLTFFSGFGLGTILMPVFALFFPVDLAIALTGVVHFFNNVFKLWLIGKNVNTSVLVRFGVPAVITAFLGAWLLVNISEMAPLFVYSLGGDVFRVTPLKFIIALLLILFATVDIFPVMENFRIEKRHLPLGGILSGFFGGVSGHQGALRSAFLIKSGLSKEGFVATSVGIACFVDITRLTVYASKFMEAGLDQHLLMVIAATLSALAGALTGRKLLDKITLTFIQRLIGILIFLIALGLGTGLI